MPSEEDRPIHVLHVDDEPDFAAVTAEFLEREEGVISVTTAEGVSEGLEHFDAKTFDCVVSDFDMPAENGLSFLASIRERDPDIPFILFTGRGSEKVASAALSAGVSDYLQKRRGTDQYELLANEIVNLVRKRRAETALKTRLEQQEIVADLGQLGLVGTAVDALLDRAVQNVKSVLDTVDVFILQLNGTTAHIRAATRDTSHVSVAVATDGFLEQAATATEPFYVRDFDNETQIEPPVCSSDSVRSGLGVRIGDSDSPWGVLLLNAPAPRAFSGNDVRFNQSIAHVLTTAIARREREQALERYETIIEALPVGVARTRFDGSFVDVNETLVDILDGEHKDAVLEQNALDFYANPTTRSYLTDRLRRDGFLANEEVEVTTLSGETAWISLTQAITEEDGEYYLEGILQDITERKQQQHALEKRTSRLEVLFKRSPDMLFVHDGEGQITEVNERAASRLAYATEELTDRTVWDITEDPDRERIRQQWNQMSIGDSHTAATTHLTKTGERVPVVLNLSKITSNEYLAIARNASGP